MSGYVPKVGDKVKATLGENVVIGEVLENFSGRVQIDWQGLESYAVCDAREGWQFEAVVSVPSKFGAVIRRADGKVFSHVPNRVNGDRAYSWYSVGQHWHTRHATEGGFTVLFDGVDE